MSHQQTSTRTASRRSRATVPAVLLAVSLVVVVIGFALVVWSRAGVTAHMYLPASKWLVPPPQMSPLGPASIQGLQRGLRIDLSRHGWRVSDTAVEVLTGITRLRARWPSPFEARWRGYLLVEEPGTYIFHLWGQQEASLALNGRALGGFQAPWHLVDVPLAEDIRIPLQPGLHSLAIDHRGYARPQTSSAKLALEWTPPGGDRQEIPADRLWSDPDAAAWAERLPEPHLPPDAPELGALDKGHLAGIPRSRLGLEGSEVFYAAYADYWDHRRFGLMEHFPGYETLWRGRLKVTEDRLHTILAETDGAVRIQVGDLAAEAPAGAGELSWSGELEPGWHDLSVSFVSPWARSGLSLKWNGESTDLEPVSWNRLRPTLEDRAWFSGRRRLAGGVLAVGLAGILVALLWLGRERSLGAASLRSGLRRGAYALALCLIMLLGLGLRLYRYTEVPHLQLSSDELHNARKGWHLMHGEGLRAWTPDRFVQFYEPEQIDHHQWSDLTWTRVRPNFDRPPLFPLLLGAFDAAIGSAESIWALRPSHYRLFPILLSVLSIPLVGALTRRFYGGRGAALLAALLYATVPMIVLNHRQAKSDVLVVLFVLLGLLAALRQLETGKMAWLWSAAAAAGLAGWAKEIGVVAVAIVPYVWLRERRLREGLTVAGVAGAVFALYFVWGSLLDFELFWSIVRAQASQASSFQAVWIFLTEGRLVQVVLPLAAGWTLWLWLSVAYAARREELPTLAAIGFLIVISGIVRVDWIFGWYWVPIYPFLCMAGGVFLFDFLRRPDLVRGALFVFTVLFMGLHAQRGGETEALAVTRGATAVALAPFALATFFPTRLLTRTARFWAFVVLLAALALGVLQMTRVA